MGEISGIFFGMSVNVYFEVTSLILEKVSIKKKKPDSRSYHKRRLGIYSRYIVL